MDAFDLLDKIPGVRHGPGGVICLYDRLLMPRIRTVTREPLGGRPRLG